MQPSFIFIFLVSFTGLILSNPIIIVDNKKSVSPLHAKQRSQEKQHTQLKKKPKQKRKTKKPDIVYFELVDGQFLEKRKGGGSRGGGFSSSSSSSSSGKSGSSSSGSSSTGLKTGNSGVITSSTWRCGTVNGRQTCGYGNYYAPSAAAAAAGYGTARYHGIRNGTSTNDEESSSSLASGIVSTATQQASSSSSSVISSVSSKAGGVGIFIPSYGSLIVMSALAII